MSCARARVRVSDQRSSPTFEPCSSSQITPSGLLYLTAICNSGSSCTNSSTSNGATMYRVSMTMSGSLLLNSSRRNYTRTPSTPSVVELMHMSGSGCRGLRPSIESYLQVCHELLRDMHRTIEAQQCVENDLVPELDDLKHVGFEVEIVLETHDRLGCLALCVWIESSNEKWWRWRWKARAATAARTAADTHESSTLRYESRLSASLVLPTGCSCKWYWRGRAVTRASSRYATPLWHRSGQQASLSLSLSLSLCGGSSRGAEASSQRRARSAQYAQDLVA